MAIKPRSGDAHYDVPDGAWTREGTANLEVRVESNEGVVDHVSFNTKRLSRLGVAAVYELIRKHEGK